MTKNFISVGPRIAFPILFLVNPALATEHFSPPPESPFII